MEMNPFVIRDVRLMIAIGNGAMGDRLAALGH
jgi:hypothetical protein